ncbi:ABC transporter ATP-binding protein [Egicoccus halophilus]|uniref:Helicase n=1 Tax=Egicoccus halophilus TaxID=1670830 RepID=A0A8J3A726_9ACTN|nr:ABC transporter ATP-binding protein [Egicoccus halophilus]GGI05060.1 helicase [Egicoccus halophilus]
MTTPPSAATSAPAVADDGDVAAAHWRLVGAFLAPHRRALTGFSLLVLVAGALPLAGPVLLGAIADGAGGAAGEADAARLALLAAAFGAVGLLANGADLLVAWLGARLAWRAANQLRVRVAAHALALGSTWHARSTPGEVVDRVDGDATRVGELLAQVVVRLSAALVTLAGVVVLLTVQDWRLGAALALLLAAGGVVLVRLRDLAVPAGVVARQRSGEVFGAAEERLRGAEELRALGGSRYAVADLHRRSALTLAPWRRQETYATGIWSASMLVVFGGGAVALLGGILLQRAGVLTIGQVLAAFTATQLTRRPLEQLAENIQQIQQAGAGAVRLGELLSQPPAVEFHGEARLPDGALEVELDAVRAAYPGADDDTLHGVTLHLPGGQHLGVVGASGGGKTTLTRLLHRSLDPRLGTVRLAGIDLREVDEASLRRRVAVVSQEVQLLSASIRDNLTLLGSVEADDDRLVAALDAVGLGDWYARLPSGLDARLGSEAGTSAGEAQLLALARVLLRDPGLVVLDEPTARLDTASAMAVTRALDVLLEGRTAVVVAHRLATLERVDRIALVRDGRIVEEGPRELLRHGDTGFARLVAAELGAVS